MLTSPIAKINLGLNVVERRPDGYHNLETVFYPVPICDALEVFPTTWKPSSTLYPSVTHWRCSQWILSSLQSLTAT